MKTAVLIGFAALLAACAGASPRPQGEGPVAQGRWQGYLFRNGYREPVSVELAQASSVWDGRLRAGPDLVALESVRVSGNDVHFEAPGQGVFDGSVAGDNMAGVVSGPASGSFALERDTVDWNPYPFGP